MVSNVTSAGTSGAATGALTGNTKVSDQIGFDTYLKLLVTQLKNQDPLNPMDGTEFTKELATFSQLEQQINSNTYLEELTKAQDYGLQSLATSYIGRAVLVPGDKVVVDGKSGVEFGYNLEETAGKVEINIVATDGSGIVRTMFGDKTEGTHTLLWDGKDAEGNFMKSGTYKVSMSAVDFDGNKIVAEPYSYGIVTAVSGTGKEVRVEMHDNRKELATDVIKVAAIAG
jgi:flagellar basal-body rod modification protein FlgD